ncbi:MAG TPA: ATP synthase F0 subunit B [Thermoanaerobaculaceae bacterium]|nr:ATP synthase F0 subunit B [Thermoanaerobaculaceae bacterium]
MFGPPNYSLFLVMACFWLVYLLVSTQLVKPLGRVLDERDATIRAGRDAYDQARQSLEEAVARCERKLSVAASEGQRERASLRATGDEERRRRIEAARGQAQQRLAQLSGELDEASRAARAVLRERSAQLARELAGRLLGRSVA